MSEITPDVDAGPLVPPWGALGDCHPSWRVRVIGDWRVMGFWRCKRHRECQTCADLLADDKLQRWVPVLAEAGAVYVASERLDASTWAERRAAGVDEGEWLKSLQRSTRRLRDGVRERLNDRGATGYLRATTYEEDGSVWMHYLADVDGSSPRANHLEEWRKLGWEDAAMYLDQEMLGRGRLIRADGGGAWRGGCEGQEVARSSVTPSTTTDHADDHDDGALPNWGTAHGSYELGGRFGPPDATLPRVREYVEERGGRAEVVGNGVRLVEGDRGNLLDEAFRAMRRGPARRDHSPR